MKYVYLILSIIAISSTIKAQMYRVDTIKYSNDALVDSYFEEEKVVQWKGLMRAEFESDINPLQFRLEKQGDSLKVTPLGDTRMPEMTLPQSAPDIYVREGRSNFMRFDLSAKPKLVTGRMVPLGDDPLEGKSKMHEDLHEKYGDQVEAFVAVVYLIEIDPEDVQNALKVNKEYEVVGVSLKVNEDAFAYGEKYNEFFMGYTSSSEKMIQDTYMGTRYILDIDEPKIRVKSKSDKGQMSFSSALKEPEEGVWETQYANSIWQFKEAPNANQAFEIDTLKYISFIELKESDKEKPEYKDLREKYGLRIPYNTIIMELEEISSD